jgi:hypothetical protein
VADTVKFRIDFEFTEKEFESDDEDVKVAICDDFVTLMDDVDDVDNGIVSRTSILIFRLCVFGIPLPLPLLWVTPRSI